MKNLVVYNITKDTVSCRGVVESAVLLHSEEKAFVPCGALDTFRIGFVPNPAGESINEVGGVKFFTIRTQSKKPKASHVNHLTEQQVLRVEEEEGRPVGRKERQGFKDVASLDVLANTFPDDPVDTQVFMVEDKIYLDTTAKKAEPILNFLRELGGSLPVEPVSVENINEKLNIFVVRGCPEPFTLADNVLLIDSVGRKTSIKGDSIYGSEAAHIIHEGAFVEEVGLGYDSCITFNLKSSMEITGIKYDKEFASETEGDKYGTFMLQQTSLVRLFEYLHTNLRG